MKKALLILCVVLVSNFQVGALESATDSIAYYIGSMYAGMVKEQLMKGEDAEEFNVDEFLAGVKTALDVDTANISRLSGLGLGIQFNQQVTGLAEQNVNIKKENIYVALVSALNKEKTAVDKQSAQKQLEALIQKAQNADSESQENISKSVAYYMGSMYAGMVKEQLMQGENAEEFNVDEFLAGVKTVLDVDTANISRLSGLGLGIQFNQQVAGLAEQNVNIKKENIYVALVSALKNGEPTVDSETGEKQLESLIAKAQLEAYENTPEAIQGAHDGEQFISDLMAQDKDVKRTESGLAYKVVKEGNGVKFTVDDQIDVIYVGKHMDGTELDNSNGKSLKMSPTGVVPGFKEALCMMSPGAKYIVYIPGKLGYGPQGQPYAKIGPNELLIFEVETVGKSVNKTNKQKQVRKKVRK